MITKLGLSRHREKVPSVALIAGSCATYFLGSLGIGAIDSGFLLLAWLMTGFLAIAVYLTLDVRGNLLNPYTLFFGGIVGASVAGYVVG